MKIDYLNFIVVTFSALLMGVSLGGYFAEGASKMVHGTPQFVGWAVVASTILSSIVSVRILLTSKK
mgnify:CR=1 FL=1|jgi:predicted esterase YcpF (UPF0227 family)